MKDKNYRESATSEKREMETLEGNSFLKRTRQWIRIRKLLDPQEEQKKRIRRLLLGKEYEK